MDQANIDYVYPKTFLNLGIVGDVSLQMPIDFTYPQMYDKFIHTTKSSIRNSIEYKQWVEFIKSEYGPVMCSCSDNILSIEVHHHPLRLEDYVHLCLLYLIQNNYSITTGIVSDMVLRLHFQNLVPCAFLSKTYHERFHKIKDIFIPEECIHGNVEGTIYDQIISKMDLSHKTRFIEYMPKFSDMHKDFFEAPCLESLAIEELLKN